jgi:hypothetical protein
MAAQFAHLRDLLNLRYKNMATTTIPKQLYVTIQYRTDANNEDGHLGFASPYTKDAAFAKRKATQDSWAYGYGAKVEIAEDGAITVQNDGKHARGGYGSGQAWDSAMLFMANCYPKILDNELVEGFQIGQAVRRYGWGGGGNVKWRITDPRGFDLEISSENFASVLACSTMVNGVIQGKCCWGRLGANNVLLPESSEPYQQAADKTKKIANNIQLKDVKLGDLVELLNGPYAGMEDGASEYLGSYRVYEVKDEYNYNRACGLINEPKVRYLFRVVNTNELYVIPSPKIAQIVETDRPEIKKDEVAAKINKAINDENVKIHGAYHLVFISPTAIKLTDLSVALVQTTPVTKPDGTFIQPYITKYLNDSWITTVRHNGYNASSQIQHKTTLVGIHAAELAAGRLLRRTTTEVARSLFYGGPTQKVIEMDLPANEKLEYYRIAVMHNGEPHFVNSVGYF